jgi:hypothetical protein
VEDCGKSRVLIGGWRKKLHQRNLRALYKYLYGEYPQASPDDYFEDDYEDKLEEPERR